MIQIEVLEAQIEAADPIATTADIPKFREADLFKEGKLHVSDAYVDEFRRARIGEAVRNPHYRTVLRSAAAYSDRGSPMDFEAESSKLDRFMSETKTKIDAEIQWLLQNDGIVPERWKDTRNVWDTVVRDLQDAGEAGFHLSTPLIDAAVNHPHPTVAETAFYSQPLDLKQLTTIFRRAPAEAPLGWARDVIASQREKGVSLAKIKRAYFRAQK